MTIVRPVGELLAWWLVLLAAWTTTLGALTGAEAAVGATVAAAGATVAVACRRALHQSWLISARWLRWLPPLALAVPADAVRIARVVVARPAAGPYRSGRLRRLPTPRPEPAGRAAARRALGTFVLSAAPGSYLVDWPPDGPPVVHTLTSGRPRLDRQVVR